APATQVQVQQSAQPSQPETLRITAGAEGFGFDGGATLGVGLMIEGDVIGLRADFAHLMVRADDGSGGTDTLELAGAHLTYALLAGERGRLRLEAGADSVFAQDLIV